MLGTALAIVAGILLFFLRRYRKRQNGVPGRVRNPNAAYEMPGDDGVKEMDGRGAQRELGAGDNVPELQGSSNSKRYRE